MIRFLSALALMLPLPALAQTVTITSPNTVNPSGQPKVVTDVFVRNADGTIATVSGGGGSSGNVAQGSSTASNTGPMVQCATVTGDQAYTIGTTNPVNCTPNGRLKVGVSNAGNINPAAQLSTTLTADLIGCKNYASRATWSDGFTGSLQCDTGGNLFTTLGTALPAGANLIGSVTALGNVASGATDSGNPVKIGAVYLSTTPTFTTGQRVDLQTDAFANLRTRLIVGSNTGSDGVANTLGYGVGSNTQAGNVPLATVSLVYNGATLDRQRGTTNGTSMVMGLDSTALGGASSASTYASTGFAAKTSAGNVASVNVVNSTAAGFLVLANLTAAPASGTAITAAQNRFCMPVAASVGFDKVFQVPLYFETGITVLFSTSCTAYTPTGTAPVQITVQAK